MYKTDEFKLIWSCCKKAAVFFVCKTKMDVHAIGMDVVCIILCLSGEWYNIIMMKSNKTYAAIYET